MGNDPKEDLVDLLQSGIANTALTDDNGDELKWMAIYARPPHTLITEYFTAQKCGVVFTVDREEVTPARNILDVPRVYSGNFIIGVWVIDKEGLTGDKVRWKAYEDLRRVLRVNYTAQRGLIEKDNDQIVAGFQMYCTEVTVRHVSFVT